VIATYYYDALGRRVRKTIENSESDNATLIYIHNPDWQILEVRDDEEEGDPAMQRFVHASGNQSQTASAYVDDHVAYDRWNGEGWDRYQYLIDKQYNTVALFGGEITERVITDPYGRARTYDSSWANPADRSRIDNPFMHQGLYFDHEAGGVGYQNRARQYNSVVGRFMQRDPLEYVVAPSLYVPYSNNPATNRDPDGRAVFISYRAIYIIAAAVTFIVPPIVGEILDHDDTTIPCPNVLSTATASGTWRGCYTGGGPLGTCCWTCNSAVSGTISVTCGSGGAGGNQTYCPDPNRYCARFGY
jgi:RHS repeat-associated protein